MSMSAEKPMTLPLAESKRLSLTWDFSWTLAGNVIYAGGQFATLMLLAKLLRPALVGQYALGLALVYPVMMFTNLQLRAVLSSGSRPEIHFGNYVSLRLLTTALGFLVIFTVTQILGYDRQLTAVILMVGLAYSIECMSNVYYARLQFHDRMAEISKSMMARALLSVLGLAIITYLTRSLLLGIAAIALGRVIVFLGYDSRKGTHGLRGQSDGLSRNSALALRFEPKAIRDLAWVSLPLGIVVLLGSLNASIPNFLIKQALGEREVGIFAAIGFVVSVGNMAVVSLGQSAYTRLARSWNTGNWGAFSALLGKLLLFGAAIGLTGMLLSKWAGREVLTLLFRPEYGERADLLPWMMAAGGVLFMAQFLGFGLTAANFYHSQVVLNVVSNMSLLGACCGLIRRRGLLGAIWAILIAAAVQLAGSVIVLAIGMSKRNLVHTARSDANVIAAPAEQCAALKGGD
jgi:O-antigen/teichoic acid export membrane protein